MSPSPSLKSDFESGSGDLVKDPLILRCLKVMAGIDWKALAIVLAALAGLGGAIWNRVDATIEKALAAKTQQGVYELLATKLDDVASRLDKLEKAHVVVPVPPVLVPKQPSPIKPQPPVLPSPVEQGSLIPTSETMAATVVVVEPMFQAIRLPSFEQVQQAAVSDRMLELTEAAGVLK